MYSKTSIKGHPIHPMLVSFPMTFYVVTFVGLCVYNFMDVGIFWYQLAYFANIAAIATALLAAIPGFVDWAIGIPNKTKAKKDGLIHMTFAFVTLGLFVINAYIMSGTWSQPLPSLGLSLVLTGLGCLVLVGVGFYGWNMISVHKVGISLNSEQEAIQRRKEVRTSENEQRSLH